MFKLSNLSFFTFCLFLIPTLSFADILTTQADGDWHTPATWGVATADDLPTSADTVIINGHNIYVFSGDATVKRVEIRNNAAAVDTAMLKVKGNQTLVVLGDLIVTAADIDQHMFVKAYGSGVLNVRGNMLMERSADNSRNKALKLEVYENGRITVRGTFDYLYNSSGISESLMEVEIFDNGFFTVAGTTTFLLSKGKGLSASIYDQAQVIFYGHVSFQKEGGEALSLTIDGQGSLRARKNFTLYNSGGSSLNSMSLTNGATVTIDSNLVLNVPTIDEEVNITTNDAGTSLNIDGNLEFKAHSLEDAKVIMNDASGLYLGKNVIREFDFGVLEMSPTAEFHFNGTEAQNIPESRLAGVGTDSLEFTNVVFNNTSVSGLTLDGDFILNQDATFTDGLINTSDAALLIVNDGSDIGQGNRNSYVNGPMSKIGTTGGSDFIFPVGDNGRYAPIGIEPITDDKLKVTTQYFGCPPPVGGFNNPLKAVNQQGYWTIERSDGNAIGDITLNWSDAADIGVSNLSTMVVAYYNNATGWYSLGRGATTGSIAADAAGSITNDLGCPPPVGGNLFAIGTTNLLENILPVELIGFRAYKSPDQTKVFLDWETGSEINSSHFNIEKSYDGLSFHTMGTIEAAGNSSSIRYYNIIDQEPGKGNNYYRIVQVDQDEIMTFSRLVNVFVRDEQDEPVLYPNPVTDYINVFDESLEGKEILIKIYNSVGACVYSNIHNSTDGNLFLSSSQLNIKQAGTYFLTYEDKAKVYSLQFLKSSN